MRRLLPILLLLLLLLLWSPLRASISCPASSTCIPCSGDINTALQNALTANSRVVLSAGSCTFSTQKTITGGDQIVGAGGLDGSTTLTYTGSTSPALLGSSDTASLILYGMKVIIQNAAVTAWSLNGFSNTSTFRDIWVDGGDDGLRLTQTTADNSTTWVGNISDAKFTNQAGHGVVMEPGNQNAVMIRVTVSGSGEAPFSFENPTALTSNVHIVGATLSPPAGWAAIEVISAASTNNSPFTVLDTTWTPANSSSDFFLSSSPVLAVNQIDITTTATADLLLDKPSTGDDVAYDAVNDKLIVARTSDGKADVSNLSAADEAKWQGWFNQIYSVLDRGFHDFTANYSTSNNVTCSGDVGSAIQAFWDGGDPIVYLSTGSCDSSVQLNPPAGARLIGHGKNRTAGGGGNGSWLTFSMSGVPGDCGLLASDASNLRILAIKIGASDTDVDVMCLTNPDEQSLLAIFDSRNGDSHVVLKPDGSNVTSSGLAIMSWLSFADSDPILLVQGANSPTDVRIIPADIGRGTGSHHRLENMKQDESSVLWMGNIEQISGGSSQMVDVTGSGTTPLMHLGTQPFSFPDTTKLFSADSDVQLTSIGLLARTNPTGTDCASVGGGNLCDGAGGAYLDKPGTADDLPCTCYVRNLVTDLAAPPTAGSDVTPPVPGNSGAITTAAVAESSLTLNWTKGTDDISAQAALEYQVYQSTTNNIGTVANAEANGTVIQSYTADIATFDVTGLSPSTSYWFNVLIRDEAANKAAYTQVNETTAASTAPSRNLSGEVSFSGEVLP